MRWDKAARYPYCDKADSLRGAGKIVFDFDWDCDCDLDFERDRELERDFEDDRERDREDDRERDWEDDRERDRERDREDERPPLRGGWPTVSRAHSRYQALSGTSMEKNGWKSYLRRKAQRSKPK
jgi:hypothetical protein